MSRFAFVAAERGPHAVVRRCRVVGASGSGFLRLAARDPRRLVSGQAPSQGAAVAFLLPGVGDHYAGMARGLYESEPVFRAELDRGYFAMVSTGEGHAEMVRELPLGADLVILRLPISGG